MPLSPYSPQNNFPKTLNKPEQLLVNKFCITYKNNLEKIHPNCGKIKLVISKEVPIYKYGIPDLVALSWNPNKNSFLPTIRSFEAKISNWRYALQQAFRYRFFSNVSIVLLPSNRLTMPIRHIDQFKKLKIGLWGFNLEKKIVNKVYTPRHENPLSNRHYEIALNKISPHFKG